MAENKIEIQIDANVSSLSKSIKDADAAVAKLSDGIQSGMRDARVSVERVSKEVSNGLGSSIAKIAGGVSLGNLVTRGLDAAFSAIKEFTVGSVAAYSEQQDALNKLGFALKASGDYSELALQSFVRFSAQMQQTSKYGDELILDQLALAKSFGATNEQAQVLVRAGADMAATFGGSLDQRVEQLGKTFSGTAGKLGQLVPELKNLTDAQLRAGAGVDLIASKLAGASANELSTHTGSVIAMKNAYSDWQEEIGQSISDSSAMKDTISILKKLFESYTTSIHDARIEQERESGSLVETADSVGQLNRKLDELKVKEIDWEQTLINPSLFDKFIGSNRNAIQQLQKARDEIKVIQDQIVQANTAVFRAAEDQYNAEQKKKPKEIVNSDEQTKIIADKQALNAQLEVIDLEYKAFQDQMRIDKNILTGEGQLFEYEVLIAHETAKINAIRDAELAKTQIIKDEGVRKATQDNINRKAEIDGLKLTATAKRKASEDQIKLDRQESATKLQIANNFMSAGLAISKEGSTAQKALMIAQATMNTYMGATNALADTRPAWLAPAMAASMIALGLANVARIAGAKFESGGIVGGSSFTGDKIGVRVNSGEMILNSQQQKEMFKQINAGGGGSNIELIRQVISEFRSMPITVQANSREIARLVRDERISGFGV
jgi:hypothetical protein